MDDSDNEFDCSGADGADNDSFAESIDQDSGADDSGADDSGADDLGADDSGADDSGADDSGAEDRVTLRPKEVAIVPRVQEPKRGQLVQSSNDKSAPNTKPRKRRKVPEDSSEDEDTILTEARHNRMQNRNSKKVHKTVRQSKRESERRMYRNQISMNEMKRKNTLIRASKPRARKHNQVQTEPDDPKGMLLDEELKLVRPSPESARDTRLNGLETQVPELGRERVDELKTVCTDNYHVWLNTYVQSMNSIVQNEQRKKKEEERSTSSSSSSKHNGTMLSFFKKVEGAEEKRVTRYFDIVYHFDVLMSETPVEVKGFDTLEEINTEFSDRFPSLAGSHCNKVNNAKRRKEVAKVERELITPRCPDCKVELIEDTKEASATCPQCGVSRRGAYSFKSTYAEIQSSSKGAAPYMRIAHVSMTGSEGGVKKFVLCRICRSIYCACVEAQCLPSLWVRTGSPDHSRTTTTSAPPSAGPTFDTHEIDSRVVTTQVPVIETTVIRNKV